MTAHCLRLKPYLLIPAAMLLLPLLSACGGGSGSGSGTLSVAMSDGPGPGITAAVVTIDKVEANVDGAWVSITTTPQTLNLLDLITNEKILGSASLPAGHYSQVRFFPSSATVTDSSGTHTVKIPSGAQTGVKVNVDYDIGSNQVTTVLLDFNVDKSFVMEGNGQYILKPVIPAVVKVLSGTVSGTVKSGDTPIQGAMVSATYTDGSNYAIGTVVNTATTVDGGSFKVWALMPGTYTISATYTDPGGTTKTATVAGVVVTADHDTNVGLVALQ